MGFGGVVGIALVAVFAIFMACDCDFYLYFMPFKFEDKGFTGKIVWITGASSGIGASLAKDLVKSGAQVIISARRENMLLDVAKQCAAFGLQPMVLPLDVTDTAQMTEAYSTIIAKFGRVDSVVLNAGRSQRNLAVDTSLDQTKALMDLNFISYVALTKLVLPDMIARKSGQLVVMSSLSGHIGTPIGSSYSASKFALHGYFDAVRAEVSMHNVHVSIVCPGPVESEISEHTLRNPAYRKTEEGKKMPTERCTYLVAKGMYHLVDEMWISGQPFLLTTYLSVYTPWLNRQLFTRFFGPVRIKLLQEGGNIYDVKQIFGLT